MDEKTSDSLAKFQQALHEALEAAESLQQANSSDPVIHRFQQKVVRTLDALVQSRDSFGPRILAQRSLPWVQLKGWYTLEGIEDFLHDQLSRARTNYVRIKLQNSLGELGVAELCVVQLQGYWTLEGIEDFLHEKIQNSCSQKVVVTLTEVSQ